jgi:hypothetical protein
VGIKSIATMGRALQQEYKARLLENGARIMDKALNLSWDNVNMYERKAQQTGQSNSYHIDATTGLALPMMGGTKLLKASTFDANIKAMREKTALNPTWIAPTTAKDNFYYKLVRIMLLGIVSVD